MSLRKMGLFVFPGHKYLGPGNELGEPVDSDDLIAQEHDRAYDSNECKENIYRTDEIEIFSFIFDWFKNRNWHSALGALGISFKHCTEKLFNRVLYPRLGPSSEIK